MRSDTSIDSVVNLGKT